MCQKPPESPRSACGTWSHAVILYLGVRAMGWRWSGAGVPCRTLSDPLGGHRCDLIRLVLVGARQGPLFSRISDVHQSVSVKPSVEPRRCLSGHIGFRQISVEKFNPDLARQDRTGLNGSLTCSVSVCTTDVRTHTGPHPRCLPGPTGPRRDPTGSQRTAGGTIGPT